MLGYLKNRLQATANRFTRDSGQQLAEYSSQTAIDSEQSSEIRFQNVDYRSILFPASWLVPILAWLLMSVACSLSAVYGSDLSADTEFNSAVQQLYNVGATKYQKAEEFRPSDNLTRQEASKLISQSLSSLITNYVSNNNCEFKDISSADPTLVNFIVSACKQWIFKWTNSNFLPNKTISKAEFIVAIMRIQYGMMDENSSPWFQKYVTQAQLDGLSKEKDLSKFESSLTRYEAALLLTRALTNYGAGVSSIQELVQYAQVLPSNQKFVLSFNSSMNKESVELSLSSAPAFDYDLSWSWDSQLTVFPKSDLVDGSQVILALDSLAKTASGEALWLYVKQFKVDGDAKITFVSPSWNISNLKQPITIVFSKPVQAITNVSNQQNCPITITPSVEGNCYWMTSRSFQFRPTRWYAVSAEYDVVIPSGIQTIAGDRTINSATFSIKTPDLKLSPVAEEILPSSPVRFDFSAKVDLEVFKTNFRLDNYSNDQLNFTYTGDFSILVFPKSNTWKWWESLTYSISSSLQNIWSNKRTFTGSKWTIKVMNVFQQSRSFVWKDVAAQNPFHMDNAQFAASSNVVVSGGNVLLEFNEQIDLAQLKVLSTIEGETKNYTINKIQYTDCKEGRCESIQNPKTVYISLWSIPSNQSFSLNVIYKWISSELSLSTKKAPTIYGFTPLDHRRGCLYSDVVFNVGQSKDISISNYSWDISAYSSYYNSDCSKQLGNASMVSYSLKWNTTYAITFGSWLRDENNYALEKSYSFDFVSPAVPASEKYIGISLSQISYIPSSQTSIKIPVYTSYIEKAKAKICGWTIQKDFSSDFFQEQKCFEWTVNVNALSENQWTIIITDYLTWTYPAYRIWVQKTSGDTALTEKLDTPRTYTIVYNDYAIVGANSSWKNLLWVDNFISGKDSSIKSLSTYISKVDYGIFGNNARTVYQKSQDYQSLSWAIIQQNINSEANFYVLELDNGQIIPYSQNNWYYGYDKTQRTFIFTDKPLYKKWDTINLQAIIREFWTDWILKKSPIRSTTVTLMDPWYQNVFTKEVSVDSDGNLVGDIVIGSDWKLWNYSLSVNNNTVIIPIEEYQKPTFDITVSSSNPIVISPNPLNLVVTWAYFYDAPLSEAKGSYRISAQSTTFIPAGREAYLFGIAQPWYFYDMWFMPNYNDSFTLNGTVNLNANGYASVNQLISTDLKNDYLATVSVTMQDTQTQKSIERNLQVTLLRAKDLIWIKKDAFYYTKWQKVWVELITVDYQSKILSNRSVNAELYLVETQQNPQTYQYEEKETLVQRQTLTSSAEGKILAKFDLTKDGQYRLRAYYPWQDKIYSQDTFYVGTPWDLFASNEVSSIHVQWNKDLYQAGETAILDLVSPLTAWNWVAIITKWENLLDIVPFVFSWSSKLSLPVKSSYMPGVTIDLRMNQSWVLSHPKMAYAEYTLSVDYQNKNIPVKVVNNSSYLPWQSATIQLNVWTTWFNGYVSVVVVDKALLALKSYPYESLLDFFYAPLTKQIYSYSNNSSFISTLLSEVTQDESANGGDFLADWVAADDMDMGSSLWWKKQESAIPPSLQSAQDSSVNLRADFKDQAYYVLKLPVTNWKATLDITKLPDDITTWSVYGIAYNEWSFANFESEFITRKNLQIIADFPPYLRAWDNSTLQAQVINNTSADITIDVSLSASNLAIVGVPSKTITIKADSQQLVSFEVRVDPYKQGINWKNYISTIRLKANSASYQDAVELKIPLYHYASPEFSYSFGSTTGLSYEEILHIDPSLELSDANAEIIVSSTLLPGLIKDLESLSYVPSWNAYSLIDALDKAITVKQLYKALWKEDEYQKIKLTTIDLETITMDQLITEAATELRTFINDLWLISYAGCVSSEYYNCTDVYLSAKFLRLQNKLQKYWIPYERTLVQKVIDSMLRDVSSKDVYKQSLTVDILSSLIWFVDNSQISSLLETIDISKIDSKDQDYIVLAKIYLHLWNVEKYNSMSELIKNNIIYIPGYALYPSNYSHSTLNISSELLDLLVIENKNELQETKHLIARWIVSQKQTTDLSVSIYDTLLKYMNQEGADTSAAFTANFFVNWSVYSWYQLDSSKDIVQTHDVLPFGGVLKTWSNSLGFELIWSWKVYYDIVYGYYVPLTGLVAQDYGFNVTNEYFDYEDYNKSLVCANKIVMCSDENIEPLTDFSKWQLVIWKTTIVVQNPGQAVIADIQIAAGFEIINSNFENAVTLEPEPTPIPVIDYGYDYAVGMKWDFVWSIYKPYIPQTFDYIQNYKNAIQLYADRLEPWTYTYTYVLQARHSWSYSNSPTTVYQANAKQIWWRSEGKVITVGK